MTEQEKPPSDLSFDLFAARVAADDTLPQSLRQTIVDNDQADTAELLLAVKKAIEVDSEA